MAAGVLAPGVEFGSIGHSCVASPSGKILASLAAGEGVAVAKLDLADAGLDRWLSIAPTGAIAGPNSIADALIAAGGGNCRC